MSIKQISETINFTRRFVFAFFCKLYISEINLSFILLFCYGRLLLTIRGDQGYELKTCIDRVWYIWQIRSTSRLKKLLIFKILLMCCIFWPAFGVRSTQTLVEIYNTHAKWSQNYMRGEYCRNGKGVTSIDRVRLKHHT